MTTPDDFIRTWSGNPLSERASAQSHFRDLCALLGISPPSPLTAGTFEFEKGASKTTGGDGWADVGSIGIKVREVPQECSCFRSL